MPEKCSEVVHRAELDSILHVLVFPCIGRSADKHAVGCQGLLKIDALSAGGSSLDEVSLLHVQGDSQYVVGTFNGDDEGILTGAPGRFNADSRRPVKRIRRTSRIKIESSAGAAQQEAPVDAVFVAKASAQSCVWTVVYYSQG